MTIDERLEALTHSLELAAATQRGNEAQSAKLTEIANALIAVVHGIVRDGKGNGQRSF